MTKESDLIDKAQHCEFCGVMAHVHHAQDCPDPLFLAAQPSLAAEPTHQELIDSNLHECASDCQSREDL